MRTKLKFLLPFLVLIGTFGLVYLLVVTSEEEEKDPQLRELRAVRVEEAINATPEVNISAQGELQSFWSGVVASQLGGKVVFVHEQLRRGGVIAQGEVLIKLEDVDLRTELVVAEANAAQAKLALEQEQVRAEQAKREWQELGQSGEPSALTLRQPQLDSANAQLKAAEARVTQAALNLDRANVVAPFTVVVEEVLTEEGNVLAPGSPVARLHTQHKFEVALPVSLEEFSRIDLESTPEVSLSAQFGAEKKVWVGKIVRSSGQIDPITRTIDLIAELEVNASDLEEVATYLMPGLFMDAIIQGKTLAASVAVPRSSLLELEEDSVMIVDEESLLQISPVEILWSDENLVYLSSGVQAGDKVVVTTLAQAIQGEKVKVVNSSKEGESN